MELPWKNNQKNISCIPAQVYEGVGIYRASKPDEYAILLKGVPGRSEILFHIANYVRQLRGCLAPGTNFRDLDRDGILDVENSKRIMDRLQEFIPVGEKCEVHIIDAFKYNGNKPPDASLIVQ